MNNNFKPMPLTLADYIKIANSHPLFLDINGVRHPAKISGSALDFPIIHTLVEPVISAQISGKLLISLAEGDRSTVVY